MSYTLTAQPIHDDGSIGFASAPPLEVESLALRDCFVGMAEMLSEVIPTYPDVAWDLTLVQIPHDPVLSNQSKYTDAQGLLRYSADGSRVFPGPIGIRTRETAREDGAEWAQ